MAAEEGFEESRGLPGKVQAAGGAVAYVLGQNDAVAELAGLTGDELSAPLTQHRRRMAGRLHLAGVLVHGASQSWWLPAPGVEPTCRFLTLLAELFLAGEAAFVAGVPGVGVVGVGQRGGQVFPPGRGRTATTPRRAGRRSSGVPGR
ncbi:hypothetical protein ACIQGO_37550 [Streptomyces shenzhenensis]|uniref:hypothetical protein n=1 Tax=Streptomyces shenzhenensis TaxID=943815 RepID=UPI0038302346